MKDITLYIPGDSFFHKCDSRVKLFLLAAISTMAYLFFSPLLNGLLLVAGLVLNYISIGKKTFTHLLTKMIMIMFAFLIVLHGFVNPAGKTAALFFGKTLTLPFFGTYTLEGFYMGLVNWLRMASIIMIAEMFVSTTSPAQLVTGLNKMGIPYQFCFMISMSLQLIPIAAREATIIQSAQRARGLSEKSIIDRFKGLLPMFVPLVVSSLDRMEKTSMALECRGFGFSSKPTDLSEITLRKSDTVLVVSVILLLAASIFVRIRFGSLNNTANLQCWADCFKIAL